MIYTPRRKLICTNDTHINKLAMLISQSAILSIADGYAIAIEIVLRSRPQQCIKCIRSENR